MRTDKVEMELFRYGSLLFGRFLGMRDDLRGSTLDSDCAVIPPRANPLWKSESGFQVHSVLFPCLGKKELCLPGTQPECDGNIIFCDYGSKEAAYDAAQAIRFALEYFNKPADKPAGPPADLVRMI